jgi:hypothetical protein
MAYANFIGPGSKEKKYDVLYNRKAPGWDNISQLLFLCSLMLTDCGAQVPFRLVLGFVLWVMKIIDLLTKFNALI